MARFAIWTRQKPEHPMHLFGLDPENTLTRVKSTGSSPRIPSLAGSVVIGSLGFALVGVASFGVWAWCGRWLHAYAGELGLYAACAVVLIGCGGALFSRLLIDKAGRRRFCGLFALAFFLYAGVWTGSYFSLRDKSGEWLASLLGPAILGMTFANAFGAPSAMRKAVIALVATHAIGYFAGSFLHGAFAAQAGMLLWGLAYGLGFGSGIGYALYVCQSEVRQRLSGRMPSDGDWEKGRDRP
jgi:hypothetical protein